MFFFTIVDIYSGELPLNRAKYPAAVELLLAFGADAKRKHSTTLDGYWKRGNYEASREITRLLLRHGADPDDGQHVHAVDKGRDLAEI